MALSTGCRLFGIRIGHRLGLHLGDLFLGLLLDEN